MVRIQVETSPDTKVSLRPSGLSSRDSTENHLSEGMQMTATATCAGAPSSSSTNWDAINWPAVEQEVRRLQIRIAKAEREMRPGKVKSLQWILTHSYSAKLLAVRRVSTNQGAKTPGVDRVIWNTGRKKQNAVGTLNRRGYRTQPLKRIYIPKSNGKLRPLSIPVMKCRAMQALHLLAVEPVIECNADRNAYGFRPKRSTADAIEQCFKVLARKSAPKWVLEGDIRACFDEIRHEWLEANIQGDKVVLRKWLKAGYVERNRFNVTFKGTPQGGVISPTLLIGTLTGLEQAVDSAVATSDKVNVVSYADDFVVTASSREILEDKVKPAIEEFLRERGLELSQEKTKITQIEEGFDFLGQNVRKYKGKMLIKPSKSNVKTFLRKVRETIKSQPTCRTENLIRRLNPMIRGWANYHRHVVAKETFGRVDNCIFQALWSWAKRRHPTKGRRWIKARYFRREGSRNWVFMVSFRDGKEKSKTLSLFSASSVPIKRHVKIRSAANPYDPQYDSYFVERSARRPGKRN